MEQHAVAFNAANIDILNTELRIIADGDARLVAQQITQILELVKLDIFYVKHGDGGGHLIEGHQITGTGDGEPQGVAIELHV